MFTRINLWLIFLTLPVFLLGQQSYQASVAGSRIVILGTSNLHDWTSKVEDFNAVANITLENGSLSGIESLSLNIPVRSIKSDHSAMDDNTYDALKAKTAPNITYRLVQVNSLSPQGDKIKISATGELSIAGVKKRVPLTVYAKVNDGKITFTGKAVINMNDYGVKPPSALFGTITTGETVTIEFSMLMAAQANHAP